MREWAKILMGCLRFTLGLWLILNISIATIPRCEQVLDFLRHASPLAEVYHKHCDKSPTDTSGPQLSTDTLCKCSMVQFLAFQMPNIRTRPLITQRAQVLHLIEFSYDLHAQDFASSPLIPPPRNV